MQNSLEKLKIQCKICLIQNPNYDISSLPLHTSEHTVLALIERHALSHPKWDEERIVGLVGVGQDSATSAEKRQYPESVVHPKHPQKRLVSLQLPGGSFVDPLAFRRH